MSTEDATAADVPPSAFGPQDRLGAANLLPPRVGPELLALAGDGRLFDLTLPISAASPRISPGMSPFSMCMWSHPASSRAYLEDTFGATNQMAFADERIECDLHTGTHVDALGHAWVGDLTYNRLTMREVVTNQGLRELGIEHLPPVVTRGVLLDIPAVRGRSLEPGEVVGAGVVRAALDHQCRALRPGDTVFVRTGWSQFYADGTDRYLGACPGIDVPAARWLAEQGVVMVGADTMGLEVWPGTTPGEHFPVHQELLVRRGVYILEQADLEPLVRAGVDEFLCVCLTPKYVGGTGAPVRLVALA